MSSALNPTPADLHVYAIADEHLAHIDATVPAHLRAEKYVDLLIFMAPNQLPTRSNVFNAICRFYSDDVEAHVG